MNYETKSLKVIKKFGSKGAAVADTLRALDLDAFTPYDLNGQLLVKKRL